MRVSLLWILCYLVLAPFLGGLLDGCDRKISARMQGRIGPPLLQPFYDVQKLFNKQTCMEMLADKLMQRKIEEREAKLKSVVGEQKNIEWGSQIRSYVFCPYTMVKDNRTNYETSDVQGVMDGDLDPFIDAYLENLSYNSK